MSHPPPTSGLFQVPLELCSRLSLLMAHRKYLSFWNSFSSKTWTPLSAVAAGDRAAASARSAGTVRRVSPCCLDTTEHYGGWSQCNSICLQCWDYGSGLPLIECYSELPMFPHPDTGQAGVVSWQVVSASVVLGNPMKQVLSLPPSPGSSRTHAEVALALGAG